MDFLLLVKTAGHFGQVSHLGYVLQMYRAQYKYIVKIQRVVSLVVYICQQFKFILCTLALFRWPQNHVNLFNVTKLFYIPWANKVVLFKHSTTNKGTFTKRYILFVYVEGNIGSLWIQNNVFTAVFTLNILNLGTSSSHHLTLVFMLIPVSFLSQTYKHTSDQILKTRFTLPGPCVPHKSTKRLFG